MDRKKRSRDASGRWWKGGALACLIAALSSFSWAGQAGGKAGQEQGKKPAAPSFQASRKEPIIITANWMEADHKKNSITYKGQVVAVQGELTMRSETLTAYYDPAMKQLKEAVAEGKVQVDQGDRHARGTRATFDGKGQTLVLTGSPVVRQGNSEVSGSRITFYITQDRAVIEGGKERVRAIIFPEEFEASEKTGADSSKGR